MSKEIKLFTEQRRKKRIYFVLYLPNNMHFNEKGKKNTKKTFVNMRKDTDFVKVQKQLKSEVTFVTKIFTFSY